MADTVDLVQDAMLNTFRRLDALEMKRRGALQAYLRRAIQNRILDELRLYRRRPGPEPLDSTTAAVTPSPLDLTLDEEAARRYREALLRLRPAERELIVGRIELGYSYDQLAMAAGRPTAESARLAVRRAILRLASEMDRAS
jgi:RNA polymerase sigma factor (sigma-70 family)